MRWIIRLTATSAPAATLLIRLLSGAVFAAEGFKKFAFPHQWGAGRFARIGIPAPETLAPIVGSVEMLCGLLLVVGFLTRGAALALLAVIGTAIATTKIPILLHSGFWAMEDAARTDYSMLMSLLFLLIAGGGRWSIDSRLADGAKHP